MPRFQKTRHWISIPNFCRARTSDIVAVETVADKGESPTRSPTKFRNQASLLASIVLAAFSFSCSKSSTPRVIADIYLDAKTPGLVAVNLTVKNLDAKDPIRLDFDGPDEIMRTEHLSCTPPILQTRVRSEPHLSNTVMLHFNSIELNSAKLDELKCSYATHVGLQIVTPDSGGLPPRYGFASATSLAFSLQNLLPHLVSKSHGDLGADSTIQIHPNQYSLVATPRVIRTFSNGERGYEGEVIAGEFITTYLGHGQMSLDLCTSATPEPRLVQFLNTFLSSVAPLFVSPRRIRTVISVPTTALDAIFAQHSRNVIAMDLNPFTPERAMRLERTLILSLLTDEPGQRVLLRQDESWLYDALPLYYAIHAAGLSGLLDEQMLFYDLDQNERQSYLLLPLPLAMMYRESILSREYYTESKGIITLRGLDNLLRVRGHSLDESVTAFFRGVLPMSFRQRLNELLGSKQADEFWNKYIEESNLQLSIPALRFDPNVQLATTKPDSEFKFLLTGSIQGYLELCGCKVMQAGGAPRRTYFLRKNRRANSLIVDLGDFLVPSRFKPSDQIELLESAMQIELMRRTKYDAIALGFAEIEHLSEFYSELRNVNSITSANLRQTFGERLVSIQGHQIALIGWADKPANLTQYDNVAAVASREYGVTYDLESLIHQLTQVDARVEGIIVIGYVHPLSVDQLLRLPSKLIGIFSSYDGRDSSGRRYGTIGRRFVAYLGSLEYAVATANFSIAHDGTLTLNSIEQQMLNDTVPDDVGARHVLDQFYNSRAFIKTASQIDSGDIAARTPSSGNDAESYAGSFRCGSCHAEEYRQWKETPHAMAFRTLLHARREHAPGCLRCHVTGFAFRGGYSLSSPTESSQNVGCETCHGAGEAHSVGPSRNNIVRRPTFDTCRSCHSPERSDFDSDPDEYFRKVVHSSDGQD